MKRLVIIFSLFVIFQIVYGQDDSGKYIKYAEQRLTKFFNPYEIYKEPLVYILFEN